MNLNELLHWRYATKAMNGQKVPAEKLERILDNIRMAASSGGLQPYRILVIEDMELRQKIREVAYDQQQITQSSHVLIFAGWDNVTPERVDAYVKLTSEVRDIPVSSLEGLRDMFAAHVKNSPEQNFAWTSKQAYIALGFGLIAAATEQVDASPMEGFDPDKLDELLDLRAMGLRSAAIMCLGYRNEENDWLVKLPKVRVPKEDLFIRM